MADPSGSIPGTDVTLERTSPLRTRRPAALWVVLAAVALGVGALAVTSGGDGDATPPLLPVTLGGVAGRETATMSADLVLSSITYVVGPDLPALGGSAPAYELTGTVDEQRGQQLAAVLGVAGDVRHEGQMWHVAGADGSTLEVYEGGGGSWWYAAAGTGTATLESSSGAGTAGCEPGPAVDCAVAETGTAECPPDAACAEPTGPTADSVATTTTVPDPAPACPDDLRCSEPTAPPLSVEEPLPAPVPDLPSEGDARRAALDLLAATGMDVEGALVTVDGPYEAWYVSVEPLVAGVAVSGGTALVAVGPDGVIIGASGSLGRPDQVGDYPLLDTAAAVGRLNAQPQVIGGGMGVADAANSASAAEPDVGPTPVDGPATTTVCDVGQGGSGPCGGSDATGSSPSSENCSVKTEDTFECVGRPVPTCVDVLPDLDVASGSAPAELCVEPQPAPEPMPMPMPEPEAVEVQLTGVEQILIPLPASDGSSDVYLVPGYRFTGDDGAVVEAVAVADESLAPTTVPEIVVPEEPDTTLAPPDEPVCEVLVEEDRAGITRTRNPCPPGPDPIDPNVFHLGEGEAPQLGIPYYVDVDVACGAFELGGEVWNLEQGAIGGWSEPTEGGSFTLDSRGHGTFVGDAAGTKQATFATGIEGDGCRPATGR